MNNMKAQINGCTYLCYLKGYKYYCQKTDENCDGPPKRTITTTMFSDYCNQPMSFSDVRSCVRKEQNKQGRWVCREYTKDYKMVSPKKVICVLPGEPRPPAAVPTLEIEKTALSEDEVQIWDMIQRMAQASITLRTVAEKAGIPMDRAEYALRMLELKGLVYQYDDKQYSERKKRLKPYQVGLIHSYSHPSGGANIPASYQVLEIDQVLPSHDPLTNFRWNPNYPKEIQDRDYSNPNLPYQGKVYEKARKLDPSRVISTAKTSVEGPSIIVDDDNVVLSGNSRVLSIILASKKYPARYKEYIDYLLNHAVTFGLDNQTIKKLKRPILVRRVAIPPSQYKVFASLANESPAMTLDLIGTLQSVAKYIPNDLVMTMDIGDEETLRAYIGSSRGQRFSRSIMKALPATKVGAYVDRGMLTEEGKALIEGVLFYKLLPNMETIEQMPKNLKNTLSFSIPEFFRLKIGTKSGQIPAEWDLTKDLHKAVKFFNRNLMDEPLDFWLRQESFLAPKEQDIWEENTLWGQTVRLLDLYRNSYLQFRNILREYASQAEQILVPPPGGPVGVLAELIDRDQAKKKSKKAIKRALSGYQSNLGLDIFEVIATGRRIGKASEKARELLRKRESGKAGKR